MINLEVGDRITYINVATGITNIDIIDQLNLLTAINNDIKNGSMKILKVERPYYEVAEEIKELLTKEEKEFLKDMMKYYKVTLIRFDDDDINFIDDKKHIVNCPDYPKELEFENVEAYEEYTLKELGLEE